MNPWSNHSIITTSLAQAVTAKWSCYPIVNHVRGLWLNLGNKEAKKRCQVILLKYQAKKMMIKCEVQKVEKLGIAFFFLYFFS